MAKETDVPAASSQEKMLLQSHHEPPCPPPRFVEITYILQGEERGTTTVVSIPPEEAEEPLEVMGSSIMMTHLFQHPISGEIYIDVITCMLSIVDLGFNTTADDHPVPGLWKLPDSDQSSISLLGTYSPYHILTNSLSDVFAMMF